MAALERITLWPRHGRRISSNARSVGSSGCIGRREWKSSDTEESTTSDGVRRVFEAELDFSDLVGIGHGGK